MKVQQTTRDAEHGGLARRVAVLEEKLRGVLEGNTQLRKENAALRRENQQLREEVVGLKRQLAAAAKTLRLLPSRRPAIWSSRPSLRGRMARSVSGAASRAMRNTCVVSFRPRPSIVWSPTRWIAARIAVASCGRSGIRPRCCNRWKSRKRRPSSRNTGGWRTGARTATSCIAPLPEAVEKAGLFGPRLTALVAFMKGVCHASFSTVRKFLRDVVRVTISRGYLAKLIAKVSESLAQAYAELFERLPGEAVLNIDETGHKENREKFWTWCFRAAQYTLFRIDKLRGSQVLVKVLGTEFNGVLGCDYFSAYRKYMREFDVLVQFCMAHLIRDVKFLLTLPSREDRAYGERVREALRELFAVIHRREQMSKAGFRQALEAARSKCFGRARPACRTRNTPATWPNVSARTGKPTSALSPRPASSRRTIWPNRRCALWSSTATSPRGRGAKKAAAGASAFGR